MVRPKEYDRDDVLDKAVALFWKQGYKAASMTDIVRATGLNTASMYKEFGDKDGLFEDALARYRQQVLEPRLQMLIDQPNFTGVTGLLESVVNGATSRGYKGCLMMNHLSQKHTISRRAAKLIGDFCARLEGLLEIALRNAQTDGEVAPDKDPAALASYITCFIHGLGLYGRHPNKAKDIAKMSDILLAALAE